MLRCARAVLIAFVLAMPLAACSSGFDPENLTDKLDFLNPKKKLPGERKAVFPGGVPGITQGVPPPGGQPGASSGQAAAPPKTEEAQEPPPKPKRVAAKPKPQPRPQAE